MSRKRPGRSGAAGPSRGCAAASTTNEGEAHEDGTSNGSGGVARSGNAFGSLLVPTSNPQQERMKACNAQAGDEKGDERKAFMSSCLPQG